MAESYSTTLEWNGSVEVGRRLAGIALVGAGSELVVTDNQATLTIHVGAESLELLRESVDAVLALLSDHDS
ncbi:MAG: hypothetical protein ACKVG2_04130 [Candidatus Poseidoniales archaeon]|jgi:hypothetical protein